MTCRRISSFIIVWAMLVPLARGQTPPGTPQPSLPEAWQAAWKRPPADCRPLQIVHGIDRQRGMPEGVEQILNAKDPKRLPVSGMRYYLDHGLGGVVCNVAFDNYLRSEANWQTLVAAVRQCEQLGLVVWLYDEHGYPSGAAGGLVLAENRGFEAQELAYDASRGDPFVLRPAYEFTHASNNYHAARRYVNLLDERATQAFITQTHEAYWKRLEPYFGGTIRAMFTDEPSLIAVNLGQIPEEVRKRVPITDPLDPAARPLPCVPWVHDLPARYQAKFGEEILPHRRSLFAGDTPADRKVRSQFWQLVGELTSERFFGALERWCGAHRVASSGHGLWEEALLHHVPLEGNGLKALARMQIPGLDLLTSDPEAVIHSGWMTAGLPASAARLNGGRRVMTEVSDFSQKMGGAGPAGLAEMQATAAWEAAWDVTEFTLYYGLGDRPAETTRAYCDYVGRLNAVLRAAKPIPQVLLYYPVCDLWSEYLPVAEPLQIESQSPRAKRLVSSCMRLGQTLQRRQIPFTLVDHEFLAAAQAGADGTLTLRGQAYRALVLPESCELPPAAAKVVEAFRASGGLVVADQPESRRGLIAKLPAAYQFTPPSDRLTLGRFSRDGHEILLVVNVGREPYQGQISGETAGTWLVLDPATGEVRPCPVNAAKRIPLSLTGRQSLLLVRSEQK